VTASAWESLLDEFERELLRDPGDEHGAGWEAPDEPLPAALAGRARDLLDRQRRRIVGLQAELETVAGHLDAVRRVPEPVSYAPAYLDVAG
jgi:hypothetical protein